MPNTGLVIMSLPKTAATAVKTKTTKPNTRRSNRNPVEVTIRFSHPGAGRPLVAASKRGVRQATASTVNETTSAATAPEIASSSEIGRSCWPPIPWASTM